MMTEEIVTAEQLAHEITWADVTIESLKAALAIDERIQFLLAISGGESVTPLDAIAASKTSTCRINALRNVIADMERLDR